MNSQKVSQCVEAVCLCGCTVVRATLKAMETGRKVSQVEGLDADEKRAVYQELKAIMAVYDQP